MKRLVWVAVLGVAFAAYGSELPQDPDSASITPMMGSVETHWVYFSDDTFSVVVGERGYDCYSTFAWGRRTNYVVDMGGGACGGSGGSSGALCYVNGVESTCPPILCHFLVTCDPCTSYGCTVPKPKQ